MKIMVDWESGSRQVGVGDHFYYAHADLPSGAVEYTIEQIYFHGDIRQIIAIGSNGERIIISPLALKEDFYPTAQEAHKKAFSVAMQIASVKQRQHLLAEEEAIRTKKIWDECARLAKYHGKMANKETHGKD